MCFNCCVSVQWATVLRVRATCEDMCFDEWRFARVMRVLFRPRPRGFTLASLLLGQGLLLLLGIACTCVVCFLVGG